MYDGIQAFGGIKSIGKRPLNIWLVYVFGFFSEGIGLDIRCSAATLNAFLTIYSLSSYLLLSNFEVLLASKIQFISKSPQRQTFCLPLAPNSK